MRPDPWPLLPLREPCTCGDLYEVCPACAAWGETAVKARRTRRRQRAGPRWCLQCRRRPPASGRAVCAVCQKGQR